MRVLTTALRHSLGWWLVAPLAAIGALTWYTGPQVSQEWLTSASGINVNLVFFGPLAAGIAALESTAWHRHGAFTMVAAANRNKATVLHWTRLAATYTWVAAGYTVVYLGYLVAALVAHDFAPPSAGMALRIAVFWALGMLNCACFVALGGTLGWRFPHPLTAPLTAVALFAVPVLGIGLDPLLFAATVYTAPFAGSLPNPAVLQAHALWFAALGLALLLSWLGSWQKHLLIVPLTCLAVAGALVLTRSTNEVRVQVSDPPMACGGTAPAVCVPSEFTSRRTAVDDALRPLLSGYFTTAGRAPDRVLTAMVPTRSTPDLVYPLPSSRPDEVDEYDLAYQVVQWRFACAVPGEDGPQEERELFYAATELVYQGHPRPDIPQRFSPAEQRRAFESLRQRCG